MRRWTAYLNSVLVLAGFLALSVLLHLPHDMEHWSADLVTSVFSSRLKTQHPRIVMVYVTSRTLEGYPYVSPIDRGLLADIITTVDTAGAKVIGLDIILDRATEPAKDRALRDALHGTRAKMVVGVIEGDAAAEKVLNDTFLAGDQATRPATGSLYFGEHHSSLVVSDHVIRTMAEAEVHDAHAPPTFAEALAKADGSNFRPASPHIAWLLPPSNGSETFLTLAAEDVLGRGGTRLPLDSLLKNKIVLIGGDFDDRDQHLTPLSVTRDDFFAGLFIHAQILAQYLAGRSVYELPAAADAVAAIVAVLLGLLLGHRSGHHYLWLEFGSVLSFVAAGILGFVLFGVLLPYNLVALAFLAGAALGHYGWVETRGGKTEHH